MTGFDFGFGTLSIDCKCYFCEILSLVGFGEGYKNGFDDGGHFLPYDLIAFPEINGWKDMNSDVNRLR